jgi:glycerophosphoryl diester phosphodiesterase
VELIAHRGMPRLARENTLASFELALQAGADAIELDVHVAVDAAVVVHHDPQLAGESLRTLTARALARSGIPTLDDVCDLVGDRAALYVEAKAAHSAAPIVECLTAHQVRAAVHSFDKRVVDQVRTLAPGLPVGLLVANAIADPADLAYAHGVRDLWPSYEIIDARFVAAVHGAGSRVIAWTVNDANDARRLRDLGVDGLCTDDVRALRAALQRKG